MKKIFCLIIILLLSVPANSQPDYNFIVSDFDTLFVLQNKDYLEMQGILKSCESTDSTSLPSGTDVLGSLDKIYGEWTELDSLIKRANKLIFPNYSNDHQKITELSKMIDSAAYNYKLNLDVLNGICSKYPKFDNEETLKTCLDEINALRFPFFKPRYVK